MLGHYLRYMLYSKPHIFIGGLMMRKVDLRMNELKKYEIIKQKQYSSLVDIVYMVDYYKINVLQRMPKNIQRDKYK